MAKEPGKYSSLEGGALGKTGEGSGDKQANDQNRVQTQRPGDQ